MYVPKHFASSDPAALLDFMQQYPFATLITAGNDGRPEATHLPVIVERREKEALVLYAHMARANAQWKTFEKGEVLVIFQEPHAYVSPRFYEQTENVPTWNYVAVHAYGHAQVLEEEDTATALLEKQMQAFEPAYLQQWAALDANYKRRLLRGIVAFEIAVTDVQGKEKLSQNRTETERARVIAGLSDSPLGTDRELAEVMRKKYAAKEE